MASGPLTGVRLLEMDSIGPVPLCGMILADLGADIVRVGRPGGHQVFDDLGEAVLHRGRSLIELDLKSAAGRADFLALAERADGMFEGLRPGVMERLGLGPEECLARNPRLVYGRATGWGQHGPLSRTAGHDINYIAMTGALHAIAQAGHPPTVPLNILGDYAGGTMFLALGMVSGLLSARATGKGQVVDAAIVDGVASLMGLFHAYLASGSWVDRPASNLLDGAAPFYRCYACQDGSHVAIGPLEPQFFAQLIERLDIAPDRFDQYDRSQWPEMERVFGETFRSKPRAHWEELFAGSDACVSPVLSIREAAAHPANVSREVFIPADGLLQPAPAPRFSSTPGAIRKSQTLKPEEALAAWEAHR